MSPRRVVGPGSGPPWHLVSTADLAGQRLQAHLSHTDPASARLVIGVPPLFVDLRAELMGAPVGRCVDDCLTLLYAYAQLGFTAQVRVAQLRIVEEPDGRTWTHGTATPRWQDDLLHGHTVLWLPEEGYLIDVTCDQFVPLDERGAGPVIAAAPPPAPAGAGDGFTARVDHGGVALDYTLLAWQATRHVLDHPLVRDDGPGHRLRGINVAGATIGLLTDALTPPTYPRTDPPAGRGADHRSPPDHARQRPGTGPAIPQDATRWGGAAAAHRR